MTSHKRRSRPIAPAIVSADSCQHNDGTGCTCVYGWIEVVIPDVLGKNEAHIAGREGQRHTSTATKRYRKSVTDGVAAANIPDACKATSGAWKIEILGVWPRKRGSLAGWDQPDPCPLGDADAVIPQALDALQHAGLLDDDARIVEVKAWNLYRKDTRATVIRMERIMMERTSVTVSAREVLISKLDRLEKET